MGQGPWQVAPESCPLLWGRGRQMARIAVPLSQAPEQMVSHRSFTYLQKNNPWTWTPPRVTWLWEKLLAHAPWTYCTGLVSPGTSENTVALWFLHTFLLSATVWGLQSWERRQEGVGHGFSLLGVRKLREHVITHPSIPPDHPSIHLSSQPAIGWDRMTTVQSRAWALEW